MNEGQNGGNGFVAGNVAGNQVNFDPQNLQGGGGNSRNPLGFAQQPVALSGASDIILSGGGEKKSRKGVIVLIVLVVLAVLAGGGFLLWRSGVFGGGTSGYSTATGFNKFMNYLYNESDDASVNMEAYAEDSVFKFEEMLDAVDQKAKTEYFNTAQQLLNDIKEPLLNNDTSRDDANMMVERFEFLSAAARTPSLDLIDLLDTYSKLAFDGVDAQINNAYSAIENLDSGLSRNYINNMTEYYTTWVLLAEKVCVIGDDVETCIKKVNESSYAEMRSLMINTRSNAEDILRDSATWLKRSLWGIGEDLNGVTIEEGQNE